MKEEKRILNILSQVDERYIEEAAPSKHVAKKPSWIKWGTLAACFCLIIAGASVLFKQDFEQDYNQEESSGHTVLQWSDNFQAEDYFKYNSAASDDVSESKSDAAPPYAETRFFSDNRKQYENDFLIPIIDSHPLFDCAAHYNSDGSLFSIELSWHRRGETEDYSDLTIIAGHQEVEMIEDCIFVEIDEQGNIVEPTITVTNRDGIQIVSEGKAGQKKKITFQNESGWYQIVGSWNDDYDSIVMLLDWLWEHPIDFTRFSMEAGDCYTSVLLDEYPDAFSNYLPDFESFGFIASETHLLLKNGVPVSFEGHYVAHVEESLVMAGNYYDVQGHTKMHWCFNTEPDIYDLQRCLGELDTMTEDIVKDALSKESSIAFTWGDNVVIIYPDSPDEAWELIASLQS
ncbi:hypothetical protein [Anaerosporobacter sp.]|uniref:hypothetical protein n=1 Tax=Anaerosporobacter sp. TaxID=1872529 RepID=UPI00286F9C8B|nr:hypothetical protein [Anaerosporobacter sp.]